jgi:hypothetical protein
MAGETRISGMPVRWVWAPSHAGFMNGRELTDRTNAPFQDLGESVHQRFNFLLRDEISRHVHAF